MKQFRIAIIDDGVNMAWLRTIVDIPKGLCLSTYHVDAFTVGPARPPFRKHNHGSVMCMLLIDSLILFGLTDDVEVISLDITDSQGICDIKAFSHALRWLAYHEVDVVSVSIGVKELLLSSGLIEAVRYAARQTIIVAAGANDGVLTYPACLSSVIGVQVSQDGQKAIWNQAYDGIEVSIPPLDLPLFTIFRTKMGWDIPNTNSAIAPIIAAQVAQGIYTRTVATDKTGILLQLANINKISISSKKQFCSSVNGTMFDPVILAVEYSEAQHDTMWNIVFDLQHELHSNQYSCVCFSSRGDIDKFCFEIDYSCLHKCLAKYEQIIHANIYLLLVPEGSDTGDVADGLITFRQMSSNIPNYQMSYLRLDDKKQLVLDIYQWVLTQFSDSNGV